MNGFDKVKDKMDNIFTPETCPHRVLFVGIMNETPISSKGPKEGNAQILQDLERNAANFGKFKPKYFMYIGPGSEKTWNFEKNPDNPQRKWDELAKQVTDVYLEQKHPILKRCIDFHAGELERGGENMHFSAGDSSVRTMTDLISSANDFCVVFRISDGLLKIHEIDFESRPNTASIVLTPRVSETVTLSRPYAADNFSICASMAEENLSQQEHHLLRMLSMQTARDQRQRETCGHFRINKQQRQLSKERTKRQSKNIFDCKIADHAEILKIGELLQTRPARNSAGMLSIPFGGEHWPTIVLKVYSYFEESVPGSELGQSKKIFST